MSQMSDVKAPGCHVKLCTLAHLSRGARVILNERLYAPVSVPRSSPRPGQHGPRTHASIR
jgi:hypothetical protein